MDQCTITLTRDCNLRCKFCYAQKTGYGHEDALPVDEVLRIVDFCDRSKIKNIVLTGGEPTLYPALFDVLRYIKSKESGMVSALVTNGIKFKDEVFCRSLVDCGLMYVDISLKGRDGQGCVDSTGVNCFWSQIKAIENVSKSGIDFTCSMVLTKQNICRFCDMVRTAFRHGARAFSFTFEIDNIMSDKRDESYLQERNPFFLIETFLANVKELNSITEDWWIEYSLPMCAYTERQLSLLEDKFACPCQIHKGNGMTLDTKMNAIPCNMFFDLSLGKFNKDFVSLDSYQHMIQTRLQQEGVLLEVKQMPSLNCKTCQYWEKCMGGCPVTWRNYSFDALMKFKATYYR